MEGLSPLHRRVAGIDVHRMLHVVTVLIEQPDGSIDKHSREFGGFKRDCRALARFGLVRGSFIPPKDLRELRRVSRYRRKLNAMCSSQINRLHKMLDDAGIKLGAVVSDIHGVSARAMVRGPVEGQSEAALLAHARGALKRKTEALAASLDGDLSERHLFVLRHLSDSIDTLQRQLAEIDAYLMAAMKPYAWARGLLQTLPGIDETSAALILIKIGDDMARFGSPERLACWAALSPGNHESAGKRKSGRTRHGNNTVRYILCECANAARMTKSTLAAKYRSLMVRKSHKKAIVAVAHKMIRLIYILLSRRQPYLDQAIDYAAISAKKNAPRWIKQLQAIGKWPAPVTSTYRAAV